MKNVLSLILALTLVFALGATAYANDVEIKASIVETYTMTIPAATTTLVCDNTEAQAFGSVGLGSARLEPNHKIEVSISGIDGLTNNADNTKIISYKVMDGENEFTSADFTDTTLKTLTIVVEQAQWDAAPAGNYSDTVTFTASRKNILEK